MIMPNTAQALPYLPRSNGVIDLSLNIRNSKTALKRLYQSGTARVRLPDVSPDRFQGVFINTSGGLTDGDSYNTNIVLEKNTQALMTSQANEKIYKSRGEYAHISNTILLEKGSSLHWLPQETILFNNGKISRKMFISMKAGAEFIGCESIVFGRTAMKEIVKHGCFKDEWIIECNGELIFVDRSHLGPKLFDDMQSAACAHGGRAFSTILIASKDIDEKLDAMKDLKYPDRVKMGFTNLGQIGLLRIITNDGLTLRSLLATILPEITGTPLPRLWSC